MADGMRGGGGAITVNSRLFIPPSSKHTENKTKSYIVVQYIFLLLLFSSYRIHVSFSFEHSFFTAILLLFHILLVCHIKIFRKCKQKKKEVINALERWHFFYPMKYHPAKVEKKKICTNAINK